jgi:hypothetical protein
LPFPNDGPGLYTSIHPWTTLHGAVIPRRATTFGWQRITRRYVPRSLLSSTVVSSPVPIRNTSPIACRLMCVDCVYAVATCVLLRSTRTEKKKKEKPFLDHVYRHQKLRIPRSLP